jgi:hypothetical protein
MENENENENEIVIEDVDVIKNKKRESKKFVPPTENEVYNWLGQYITEKRLNWSNEKINTEASKFFNYYESSEWYRGKNKVKNWNAALRNWVTNNATFEIQKSNQNGNTKATQREQQLDQYRQHIYNDDDQLRDIQRKLAGDYGA